jgi:dolichol-phosphate mannosyltransferase
LEALIVYYGRVSIYHDPLNSEGNLLLIPSFNCSPQIGPLIEALAPQAHRWDEIWFVDNGSTDETLERIVNGVKKSIQSLHNVRILQNSENIGLGGTHKIALKKAIAQNFKTVTIFHGDYQARFDDAVGALALAQRNPKAFILGSRFSRKSILVGYSKLRIIFNYCMNLFFSVRLRHRIRDLGSGLNIIPLNNLKSIEFDKLPNDLTFNIELLKWMIINQKEIIWLPITWIEEDQISNVNITRQVHRTLKLLFFPFGELGVKINSEIYQIEIKMND